MKLIIAEKPSLGRNIAAALGVTKKGNGYLESDKYIISWAFGHLYGLKDVDDYLGKKTPWKNAPMPYIPSPFQFKMKEETNEKTGEKEPDPGIKKHTEILKKLIERKDVKEVVNAGDADREGQIIIDILLNELGNKKPVKRLWLPEQTEGTIQKQIKHLEDNKKYHNLAQEGYARTYMDWLFGINLTRYVSVKVNKMFPVGRVLIPVVKQIYDRDLEIRNFVKKKYYQLESKQEKDGVVIPLILKESKFDMDKLGEAQDLAQNLNTHKARVKVIEKSTSKKSPPKLFSLSKLQGYLSKKHKIDFAKSLELIQSLYEKGHITYPRTNTEYLAENEKSKVSDLIIAFSEYPLEMKDSKRIFDDSKIESHSAIIPTTKRLITIDSLESIVYDTIVNRFLSNFCKRETITEKVIMKIVVADKEFILNGETLKEEGYLKYEPEKFENQLPELYKDDEFDIDFKVIEKETSPPKKVSEEDLANYLKNPFRKESDTEDEEYVAMLQGVEIGTEATRTGIVENAKNYKYISQKGSNYSIEPLGEKLIEILDKLEINMYKEKSVEFSKLQKQVYKGEIKLEDLNKATEKELLGIISKEIEVEKFENEKKDIVSKEVLGKCLKCDGEVTENVKAFSCNKCNFALFKESIRYKNQDYEEKFEITSAKAKKLLKGGSATFKTIKKDKTKKDKIFKITVKDGFIKFDEVKK